MLDRLTLAELIAGRPVTAAELSQVGFSDGAGI
jgi:hypothetical protein